MNLSFLAALSIEEWRDLLTILLAFLGLVLLVWRSFSVDKQARASQKQTQLTETQLHTTQQDALDARYQRIADMLGSDPVSTRRIAAPEMLLRKIARGALE